MFYPRVTKMYYPRYWADVYVSDEIVEKYLATGDIEQDINTDGTCFTCESVSTECECALRCNDVLTLQEMAAILFGGDNAK